MQFLVIIPCFKEMINLQKLIPQILKSYPNSNILVVDDYSGDLTDIVVKDLASMYPKRVTYLCRKTDPSYAASLLEGFHFAACQNFEKIIQMDADGSHSVYDIRHLLESTANVAIGSRYIKGSKVISVPVLRQLASIIGNIYISVLWRTRLRDKTNGFRCFDRNTVFKINEFQKLSEGFAVQIELLYFLMNSTNIRIEEVPITFEFRTIGESKFNLNKLFEALKISTKLALRGKNVSFS